ncbi:LacI family transcriptional regulator [Leifsonia sp. Root227]|uniref:LacI family DNA-binding transcriptional regulator n=1 Tax=unclassified Leifsonia TaxID=2663824 RepID=UPI0006F9186A|nr:LacI family DNA-binding transcriptional regulator [Leifsonia sp. Root227]KRC46793.1 LacI family transcriptional regulator [Leifsonia sp. Root227]
MVATLKDVAAAAGVSVKTASNVVNGYEFVKASTRERVLSAIQELGYQPNLAARNLRAGRTGVIGLAVPSLSFSYFAELADAVLEASRKLGFVTLIEQTGGDRDVELELLRGSRLSMLDGLLFSPLGMSNDDAEYLNVDYPLVLLGERIFEGPTDHVLMQNVNGGYAATAHLLNSGRRRIAVLGAHRGELVGSASLRLEGYRRALTDFGVDTGDELVVFREGWHRADGAAATQELLSSGTSFDAIFALNDELALGALRILHQENIRVPEDVAVIGFDNLVDGQFAMPSLSTIDPGRADIADRAVTALIERIGDRAATKRPPRVIEVPFTTVARESTVSMASSVRLS